MEYQRLYRAATVLSWWGRMEVRGLEHLPLHGGVIVVANHDSQMDPVLIWIASYGYRPLRFLARANLWDRRWAEPFMTGMRHIPIERGEGDARAIDAVIDALREGEPVVLFPEGGLSHGQRVRARRGVARVAQACPDVPVLLVAVSGTTDYVRFPRRPRVTLTVFPPAGGRPRPDEDLAAASTRLMDEIRAIGPPARAGRDGPIARRLRERRHARRAAARTAAHGTPEPLQRHAVHH